MAKGNFSKKFNKSNALSRNYSTRVGGRTRRPTSPVRRRVIQPIYSRFSNEDIVQNAKADTITAAMWSNNDGELFETHAELFTSSVQMDAAGLYYAELYREDPQVTVTAEPQFSIAYGNSNGSGSAPISEYSSEGMTPTKAIYQQYRNLLLAPGDDYFTITDSATNTTFTETGSVFININRQRFKERIDPGNWELTISSSQFTNNVNGVNGVVLTDDSAVTSPKLGDSGALYKVVTGSMGTTNASANQYGWIYPDMGVIMLSARALGMPAETNYCWCPGGVGGTDITGTGNQNPQVHALIGAFTGSSAADDNSIMRFAARSSERVYSTHYFIRLKNNEYNFSNNPSFTSGSQGQFSHPSMYRDPHVYITTVGMYNDRNELLAIAKLSKPLLKSFTREALIRVKLEF
tara:strand:+ start:19401 stop:20618 length:1218 start_codon:yes stop_codon:yes gene_type:complete